MEEIASVYLEGWRLGLKAIAIYRDGCKRTQPLNTSKDEVLEKVLAGVLPARPYRRKLPDGENYLVARVDAGCILKRNIAHRGQVLRLAIISASATVRAPSSILKALSRLALAPCRAASPAVPCAAARCEPLRCASGVDARSR